MDATRNRVVSAAVAISLVVAVTVLALFQPWKLWVDERVETAAPTGAAVVTVPAAPTETTAPVGTVAPTQAPAPTETTAPMGTRFVSLDHGTTGTLLLLVDADRRQFVRIEDLETDNGPDLKVYLSANPPDGPEGAFDDDFVDLGRLQGNLGSQNYELPAGTDLSRFRSVVIWCDRFNSAFGAAPLA